MGSSERPKPSGRPQQVLPSGEPLSLGEFSAGGEGQVESAEEFLAVWLVRIDPSIHAKTSVGDAVSVEQNESTLQIMTTSGRLGDIPPHSSERVISAGAWSGLVNALVPYPLKVQVQLAR